MASCSRRGTTLVRDEEPRRDEELGQQGLPVPPPPLVVDFGAVMQGLVQVM